MEDLALLYLLFDTVDFTVCSNERPAICWELLLKSDSVLQPSQYRFGTDYENR